MGKPDSNKKIPSEVAKKALSQLNTLIAGSCPTNKNQSIRILNSVIAKAFDDVSAEDNNSVYRNLSLELHPDKMKTRQPKLFNALEKLDLINTPLHILTSHKKEPSLIKETITAPVTGLRKTWNIINNKLKPILNKYKRYWLPIKLLVKLISWAMNIALTTAAIGVTVAALLAICLSELFTNAVISLVTKMAYEKQLDDYRTEATIFEKSKKDYLNTQRANLPEMIRSMSTSNTQEEIDEMEQLCNSIPTMNDDELFNVLVNRKIQATLTDNYDSATALVNSDIKNTIIPFGYTKVKLVAKALWESITKPLPNGFLNALFSVLLFRIPLMILALPVLALSTATEMLKITTSMLYLTAFYFLVAVKAISQVAINLPLYILDAGRYLLKAYIGHEVKHEKTEEESHLMSKKRGNNKGGSHSKMNNSGLGNDEPQSEPPLLLTDTAANDEEGQSAAPGRLFDIKRMASSVSNVPPGIIATGPGTTPK